MDHAIPLPIIYAGLVGVGLSLFVAVAQNKWSLRVFFLLALRLAIGWHFLFEGLYKINTEMVGATETNRVFTSEPYFKVSPTWMGEHMRKQFDDPAAAIQSRVIPAKLMTAAEFKMLSTAEQAAACPDAVRKEFDDLLEAAEGHVKAEAVTDKKDAKKAFEKEIAEAEDAKLTAIAADEQELNDRIAAEKIEHWKRLAETEDAAERKKIAEAFKAAQAAHANELKVIGPKREAELAKKKAAAAEKLAKKEKAADEKAASFKAIAAEEIEDAKIAYAAWVYGAQGRDAKVKFSSDNASLTAPQRLAQLEWLKSEAAAAQNRSMSGMGNGNGVELKRATELRTELLAAEADLAKDSYVLDVKKALTGKEGEIPKSNAEGKKLDSFTMYFITAVGACILFGLFTRISCVLAAGFLVVTYLTHPPFPWYTLPPMTEGNPLFVNKNLIECLALLALACYPTGRWLGLDAVIGYFLPCGRGKGEKPCEA